MGKKKKDSSSIFWSGILAGVFIFVLTDKVGLAVTAALVVMFVSWMIREGSKQTAKQAEEAVRVEERIFDFDALSTGHKSRLLKQQFDHFLKYRTVGSNELEFYCADDQLDGYRFSFWIEYLVDNSLYSKEVKVREGSPICNVYIYSNKGRAYGSEKFTVKAPAAGIVTGFLKGSLQKGCTLFKLKEEGVAAVVNTTEEPAVKQAAPVKSAAFYDLYDEVMNDLAVENGDIQVEKLDDVLRWEMPSVDDIELPDDESSATAFDTSATYHATITNLSDFDWCSFRAVCYSSADDSKKEVKQLGNVKIGEKTLLSSSFDMFYLEGQDRQGVQKRFRPFALERDSDITVTTIFIERS